MWLVAHLHLRFCQSMELKMSNRQLNIPFDVADGITIACLTEQRESLPSELNNHIEKGESLHPDDVSNNFKLIYCLTEVIKHYGGE